MRSMVTRRATLALGVTLGGISLYLLHLMFRRGKDEDDSPLARATNARHTVEVPVPRDLVPLLIGRSGQNVKEIQEQTHTDIHFHASDDGGHKICTIRGTKEGCDLAENLVRDRMANQPVVECEDIWVPQKYIARLIGRSGDRINEIRVQSGANVAVHDGERSMTMKRITIKGTRDQILVAKSLVETAVAQFQAAEERMDTVLAKREPRGPLRADRTPPVKTESLKELRGAAQFEVFVSAVVSPSLFWVQIVGPKASELDMLVEEMTEYYNREDNRQQHALAEVRAGDLVAGVFEYDNKWYRAEVKSVDEVSAELYYVDYGDVCRIGIGDVCELRTDFLRLSFQAIQCHLGKVAPNGTEWTTEAIDRFEEWTHTAQWVKLTASISGYTSEHTRMKRSGSPVPCVDLVHVQDDLDINVADELVKSGYAVSRPEAGGPSVTKEPQFSPERTVQSPSLTT